MLMMQNQIVWRQNEIFLREFFFEILRFYHTNLYIFISWFSGLNLSTFRFTNENCSSWESTWWFWKRFCLRSFLKRRIRYSRKILICFELRTFFDLKIKDDETLLFIFKRKAKNRISKCETLSQLCFKK